MHRFPRISKLALPALISLLCLTVRLGKAPAHPHHKHRGDRHSHAHPHAHDGHQAGGEQRESGSKVRVVAGAQKKKPKKLPDFAYDDAGENVNATVLDEPLRYDADLLPDGEQTWYTWLEFVPGKGDLLLAGIRKGEDWQWREKLIEEPGDFARPTLTRDSEGRLWLSYEQARDDQWDVMLARLEEQKLVDPRPLSTSDGPDIRHRAVADRSGGLWFVWQSDQDGQFDIAARHVTADAMKETIALGSQALGDWHPSAALADDGTLHLAWDAHDGQSHNVMLASIRDGEAGKPQFVVGLPAFEGRVQLAAAKDGRVWIAWEEGGENWGRPYRPKLQTTNMSDQVGPLHRFRLLRFAYLDHDGALHESPAALPMPLADAAAARDNVTPGIKYCGAFYERARLAVDENDRLWVAYRHFYTPWLGVTHRSHVEAGWGVYARCLTGEGWSPLYRFSIGQGDGLQRLEIKPSTDGIAAVWTTGRTHRSKNKRPRGIVTAAIHSKNLPVNPPAAGPRMPPQQPREAVELPGRPEPVAFDGQEYHLFYGDLHRHTDLSLCRVPIDGTIDDAYRYAIDAARLDFLGITDHSRDVAMGDPLSQLWWRSRKEVQRHALGRSFFPFYAYERSHGNTADHNVISLRDDMLRPHTYPVPVFWKEIDPKTTITIPHQPIRRDTWNYQDDERRPVAEIYQGARDRVIDEDLHRGLDKGYHLGIIASSDHMSTSASYACVWATEPSRAAIFQALRNRRTFGATSKIRLVVRAGGHWMGEKLPAGEKLPPLEIEAAGTAPIRAVNLIVDGRVHETLSPGTQKLRLELEHELDLAGNHYVYVHLLQADGNQAWSSPIWVQAKDEAASE